MIPVPHPSSPEFQRLPSWARKLLNRPLVEIRRGLSFDYDAPTENHSVVVLTAPSGKYVDVRFASASKDQYEGIKKSDGFNGFATAGLSTSWLPGGTASCPAYDCVAHVKWEHPIDSSREFGTDGADMYLLSNGNVMEVGFLTVNGKTKMFKEYWFEAELSSPEKPPFLVAETTPNDGQNGDPGKGMIIRIDDYCQGILQTDTEFHAERWQIRKENEGGWTKDPKSTFGHETLPCEWAMAETTNLGDSIVFGGRTWTVVESDKR